MRQPEQDADDDHQRQRRGQAPSLVHQQRSREHARQAEHGTHGEVDAAGNNHERHAERQDAGLGDRTHDVGDVLGPDEQDVAVTPRREDESANHHQDQAEQALEADQVLQRVFARARWGSGSGGRVLDRAAHAACASPRL